MKKRTHLLSGVLLSEIIIKFHYQFPLSDSFYINKPLSEFFESGVFLESNLFILLSVLLCCMVGTVFPDFDIFIFPDKNYFTGFKKPGKFHRTITHWSPVYVFLIFLSFDLDNHFLKLFSISCLAHILLDSFTKSGVPILTPFGNRYGFNYVFVGGWGEKLFALSFILIMFLLLFI